MILQGSWLYGAEHPPAVVMAKAFAKDVARCAHSRAMTQLSENVARTASRLTAGRARD